MPQTARLPKDVAVGKTWSCNPSSGHPFPADVVNIAVKTALEGAANLCGEEIHRNALNFKALSVDESGESHVSGKINKGLSIRGCPPNSDNRTIK